MQSRAPEFMDLPSEVRILIWVYALRPLDPSIPGVHFFSLVNKGDGDQAARISTRCKGCGNGYCSGYHLAAPKLDPKNGSYSWTSNNPSTYLWDFGMWTACKESRQVIKAHYKTRGWTITRPESRTWSCRWSRPPAPIILQSNDREWNFVFDPKRDLVCLQAFDPNTIHWWASMDRNKICFGDNGASFSNFSNVAMAYDPSWNNFEEHIDRYDFRSLYKEPSARGFFLRTIATIDEDSRRYGHYIKNRAFWLIDYNLKQIRGLKRKKGRKVFYGNNQTFVEVDRFISRRNFSSEYSSALEFLDNLNRLLLGQNISHCVHHIDGAGRCCLCNNSSYSYGSYYVHGEIRVLMCEDST